MQDYRDKFKQLDYEISSLKEKISTAKMVNGIELTNMESEEISVLEFFQIVGGATEEQLETLNIK